MKLHLLRHTRPDVPEGICYGQSDVDVAGSFGQELEKVRGLIGQIDYTQVYCSPLQRCVKLARGIGIGTAGMKLDERLMEMHFGNWEMKKWGDIEQGPEARGWFADYMRSRVPEGESYRDLQERVRDFIRDLQVSPDKGEKLIICHKGIILAFMALTDPAADEAELFRKEIAYGALITLELKRFL